MVGPPGIGKTLFARTLAQALLCERNPESALDPCGKCPSCLQIIEGSHPDVLRVAKPEDRQELPIRVIRELCIDLGLKPMHGTRRIAIVEDADELSEEAANAFLKTLEEPPPGSVLMLVGAAAESQIPTIVSRCRVLRFEALRSDELASILVDEGIVNDLPAARVLAERSEGSVSRAKGLADLDLGPFRNEMVRIVGAVNGFDPLSLAKRLDTFSKDAGKESGPQRERAVLLIGELARLFRGVLWQTAGVEPATADPVDAESIRNLAERLEPEDVFSLADRCFIAIAQVERNAGRTLVYESLCHDLANIINQK